MFTIIGGDGKEYGPVSSEQVRAWLAGGRASLTTKAKAVGTEEWRTLGDFAEFTGTGAPPPPLATGEIDPKAFAADLIARAGKLDIFDCIGRSWELLKANFWPNVGVTFVVLLAACAVNVVPILGWGLSPLLGGVFSSGLYLYYVKQIRGQSVELGDAFGGFSQAFWPLVLTSIVVVLMLIAGFICLVLPGIYLAVSYSFAYLLVLDRKMEFWAAMEVSRRVITAQWWRMLGLLIIGSIVGCSGAIALGFGLLITLPIFIGALAHAYEDLCNPPPKV